MTAPGEGIIAAMERFAAQLPLATERIPTTCKMTWATYTAIKQHARPELAWATPGVARFSGVQVHVDDDIDAPWIVYDQHGDEMQRGVARTADAVLANHRVVRDGSVWLCPRCKATWPYPAPVPTDAGPCVPRRWGDQ